MCLGAIYWSRAGKIYYANTREDAKEAGFDDAFIYDEISLPIEKRHIAMTCITMDNAKDMFTEWVASNKILY